MAQILVVDDSDLSRFMITAPLEEAGHSILEAADGREALEVLAESSPDCIVTDLLMPVLDGYRFLAEIRQRGMQTPVVVVSADVQSTSRAMCEELGIDGFLTKPWQPATLRAAVDGALARTRGTTECR